MADTLKGLKVGQVQTLILSDSLDIETIESLKNIADQYDTEVLMIGEDEDFGKMFTSTSKSVGYCAINKESVTRIMTVMGRGNDMFR